MTGILLATTISAVEPPFMCIATSGGLNCQQTSEAAQLRTRLLDSLGPNRRLCSPQNLFVCFLEADFGQKPSKWITCVTRHIIRKPKARLSAGTRPTRTASCWKTTICLTISRSRLTPSSITTITGATTKAYKTSRPLMSTSDADRPFKNNENGSNRRQSKRDACFTASPPHNHNNQMSQILS